MFDNSFHAGNALIFPMAVLFTFQQALISNSCFDCDSEHAIESVFRIDRDFKPHDQNLSLFFDDIQCLANVALISSFIFVKEHTNYFEQLPNNLLISIPILRQILVSWELLFIHLTILSKFILIT